MNDNRKFSLSSNGRVHDMPTPAPPPPASTCRLHLHPALLATAPESPSSAPADHTPQPASAPSSLLQPIPQQLASCRSTLPRLSDRQPSPLVAPPATVASRLACSPPRLATTRLCSAREAYAAAKPLHQPDEAATVPIRDDPDAAPGPFIADPPATARHLLLLARRCNRSGFPLPHRASLHPRRLCSDTQQIRSEPFHQPDEVTARRRSSAVAAESPPEQPSTPPSADPPPHASASSPTPGGPLCTSNDALLRAHLRPSSTPQQPPATLSCSAPLPAGRCC
ncbi:proline-rich protein 36-like [Eucalyptus grandis]|uniref:proline-rich protein 36-like n=1 Tax=Eucalyptus grandis TaxID=71139 RepID=UPI00192EA9FA|nr:proline-rich protein 36-like [Eucalyptus grandis]